jgi:mannose-6-phosphate isomerase-like protein (cupin superfamily)
MRFVRKEDITVPFRGDTGELIFEMIGRRQDIGGTTKHSFAHVVLPSGKASPAHFHKVSEETYYVLAGEAHMQIEKVKRTLRPGDACLIMPREVHQIRSIGSQDLEFIAVSGPAWVRDDTFYPEAERR